MNVTTIPCFSDNYAYLLVCPQTREAAVVDPSDGTPVLEEVRRQGVTLTAILCTHHHMDHVAGNEALIQAVPGIKVFGHRSDKGRIPGQNVFLEDGDTLEVGGLKGHVTHNPGHTSGGISYFFGDAVFTGDTLFAGGCGRLFEGDAKQMYASLNEKIGAATPSTRVFFGHEYTESNLQFALTVEPGNDDLKRRLEEVRKVRESGRPTSPSTLELERRTNPFLRCDSPGIQATVKVKDPGNDLTPVSVFRVVRQLKDQF